jgi:hypothetical protein
MTRKRTGLPAVYTEIRKELVRTHGCTTTADLAKKFKVSTWTVTRARMAINRLHPIKPGPFDELAEITRALQAFDDEETELADEMDRVDKEIEAQAGTGAVAALFNCRCNLIGQKRDVRVRRLRFLMDIGYLKEAAKRLDVGLRPIAEMSVDELKVETDRLENLLEAGVIGANGD